MQQKISVTQPIVNLEGDEMAHVLWLIIKNQLILPFLDMPLITYDLSIENRKKTDDAITLQAAQAVKTHHVAIKCATITPNKKRQDEFQLKRLFPSPNATIRNHINGTLLREPILATNIKGHIPAWGKPIIIARHAYADQYDATEIRITKKATIHITDEDQHNHVVHDYATDGIAYACYNSDDSIRQFARTCMRYALERQMDLYFATKDTILKVYDGTFRDIFQHIYEKEFQKDFENHDIQYHYRLIDDMAAMVIRSSGGFIWACKNYDGDVMSDLVAQGFGSLGMMTSLLITEDGSTCLSEAAHGTITSHFRMHQNGQETSSNPLASIFAWSRGLLMRAKIDGNTALMTFCHKLETACLQTLTSGMMTKDLALLQGPQQKWLTTKQFIAAIAKRLDDSL